MNNFKKILNKPITIRLLLIITFFLLPFSRGPMASVMPIKSIKMEVLPPGYPPTGSEWEIQVYEVENNLYYTKLVDCRIVINTTNDGNYLVYTNEEGIGKFTYLESYGDVTIQAISKYNRWSIFYPQTRFIPNSIAQLIIAFYGIGSPLIGWEFVTRLSKSNNSLTKVTSSLAKMTFSIGWIIAFFWIMFWKFGSEWGFGNRIIHPNLLFDPHLLYLTYLNILLLFTYPILSQQKDP